MKEVTVEEKKQLSLEILSEIDSFCKKNNIQYFLQFGTLLGAIRHSGFIPWDDDIDISMPRPDYEKFLKIFSSEKYEIANYRKKGYFPILFSKVYAKNTYGIYYNDVKLGYGIAVDVFPLDGLPSNEKKSRFFYRVYNFVNKYYSKSIMIDCKKTFSVKETIKNQLFKFLFNVRFYAKLSERIARFFNYSKSKYATSLLLSLKLRIIDKSCYEIIEGSFEQLTVNLPRGYDSILKETYGPNYMTPPPEKDRVSSHDERYYWVGDENE